jgi:hypothetical protein
MAGFNLITEVNCEIALPLCSLMHKMSRECPSHVETQPLSWIITNCSLCGGLLITFPVKPSKDNCRCGFCESLSTPPAAAVSGDLYAFLQGTKGLSFD